ncbi:MAG: TRAP transporter small permease subunit [Alphaproteobacteria bacterium]|uniref:TRAP transporter small permease n=1 Tax=Pacificispira sp. TaxID=2888761 RepID=UPI001B2862DC|nr:TRAP transporter small permease subunit [Alphaproteobacteria bacterium]MBO6861184.1 TRAP transporter small permease subunit [Alphaproteobacteria bacterium]MEC9265292.1 TRAP transporter small permease subunit [Pseudomonadota bacterium]
MLKLVARAHDAFTRISTIAGGSVLFVATAMYVYEVAVRYFFNAPTVWTSDWTSYFLAVVIFTMIPELARSHGHISIELVPEMLPPVGKRVLETITMLTAAGACLFSAWVAYGQTLSLFKSGVVTIASAPTPKWWIMAFIAYGFANAGLYFLRHAATVAQGKPLVRIPSEAES